MKKPCIGIIGSGNMAFCLGKGLSFLGYTITEIHSRNIKEGKKLSKINSSKFISNMDELEGTADIYFFCLPDDSIQAVSKQFPFKNKLCVHTSGSMSIAILKKEFTNCAVFYPVQSFNKNLNYDWSTITICIEGSTDNNKNKISKLAKTLSKIVINLNSEKRKDLHLAAVFANNFSNACFQMAAEILNKSEIPFSILRPLILSNATKLQLSDPKLIQTGPAIRHDNKVLKMHEQQLKYDKDLTKIYKLISKFIQRKQ